jgi:hypothetical protein
MTLELRDPQIVIAIYLPRDGSDSELRTLIAEHAPTLRRLGLLTDRAPVVLRSANGSYIEIFEWTSGEAADRAHDHPEVARMWEAIAKIADFKPLASLPEAAEAFSHFEPLAL